jgi:uncharacterized membrane protein YdjX (TVP38/TMEM64 family)
MAAAIQASFTQNALFRRRENKCESYYITPMLGHRICPIHSITLQRIAAGFTKDGCCW